MVDGFKIGGEKIGRKCAGDNNDNDDDDGNGNGDDDDNDDDDDDDNDDVRYQTPHIRLD